MTSLNWNIGSLANHTYNQVDGIPSAVSGTMIELATMAIIHVENVTGKSLNTALLDDTCIPALKCFTMSELLEALHSNGVKASDVRIGEFSIGKGQDLLEAAKSWENTGMEKIRTGIGIKSYHRKANG